MPCNAILCAAISIFSALIVPRWKLPVAPVPDQKKVVLKLLSDTSAPLSMVFVVDLSATVIGPLLL